MRWTALGLILALVSGTVMAAPMAEVKPGRNIYGVGFASTEEAESQYFFDFWAEAGLSPNFAFRPRFSQVGSERLMEFMAKVPLSQNLAAEASVFRLGNRIAGNYGVSLGARGQVPLADRVTMVGAVSANYLLGEVKTQAPKLYPSVDLAVVFEMTPFWALSGGYYYRGGDVPAHLRVGAQFTY